MHSTLIFVLSLIPYTATKFEPRLLPFPSRRPKLHTGTTALASINSRCRASLDMDKHNHFYLSNRTRPFVNKNFDMASRILASPHARSRGLLQIIRGNHLNLCDLNLNRLQQSTY